MQLSFFFLLLHLPYPAFSGHRAISQSGSATSMAKFSNQYFLVNDQKDSLSGLSSLINTGGDIYIPIEIENKYKMHLTTPNFKRNTPFGVYCMCLISYL